MLRVWIVYTDEWDSYKDDRPVLLTRLSPSEITQVNKYYFDRDARNHLIGRTLIRRAYHQLCTPNPNHLHNANSQVVEVSKHAQSSKPYVAAAPHYTFNLSHADHAVALLFTQSAVSASVGIDVMRYVHTMHSDLHTLQSCFSTQEWAVVAQEPDTLMLYWVLKEAYIKHDGAGLAIDLALVAFDLPAAFVHQWTVGMPPLTVIPLPDACFVNGHDASRRVAFAVWRDDRGYVYAICVDRDSTPGVMSVQIETISAHDLALTS